MVRAGGWSWRPVAVLGLVGSLLAAGGAPPGGAARDPGWLPAYSACVGPASDPAGFGDVGGSFAEDAVNCLFHYGITKGRTADRFDLDSPVRRWEMALFMARAAEPAGIRLPLRTGAGFEDIGGLFTEARDAIERMVELRVMFGARAGFFEPDRPVSRVEMVQILEGFLRQALVGPGGVDLSDVDVSDNDEEVFTDLDGVSRGESMTIIRMFEMGITEGTRDGRFSPEGTVTRAQMAVFITRMLAHTEARPAGVTIQAAEGSASAAGGVELAVSVRDQRHMPDPYATVDLFSARDARRAIRSGGSCDPGQVEAVDGGSDPCVIEVSDLSVGSAGNLTITYAPGETRTVWAWSGGVGDEFDADEHPFGSVRTTAPGSAVKLRATDDMPSNAQYVRFDRRITFIFQLVDSRGNPVAARDVQVTIAAVENVLPSSSSVPETGDRELRPHRTDASGRVVLSYRYTDPVPGSRNLGDIAEVILNVTSLPSGLELDDRTTLRKVGVSESNTEPAAVWRDTTGGASATLALTQEVSYHMATGIGGGAANRITATLTDLYGRPISGAEISFTSDDQDGIGAGSDGEARVKRRTDRRGQVRLTYTRDSDESGAETITAAGGGRTAAPLVHYWTEEPDRDDLPITGRLLYKDFNTNRLVIEGEGGSAGKVLLVAYDRNDHLNGLDGPATLIDFERDLANTGMETPPRTKVARVRVEAYSYTTNGVSRLVLCSAADARCSPPGG